MRHSLFGIAQPIGPVFYESVKSFFAWHHNSINVSEALHSEVNCRWKTLHAATFREWRMVTLALTFYFVTRLWAESAVSALLSDCMLSAPDFWLCNHVVKALILGGDILVSFIFLFESLSWRQILFGLIHDLNSSLVTIVFLYFLWRLVFIVNKSLVGFSHFFFPLNCGFDFSHLYLLIVNPKLITAFYT